MKVEKALGKSRRPEDGSYRRHDARSPIDLIGEEFGDEVLIERKNRFHIGPFAALGVQAISIEAPHPRKHFFVVVIHQVAVGAMTMRGIERVIAEHVQSFFREIGFRDLIDVLVMPEGEMDVVEPATRRVNAA